MIQFTNILLYCPPHDFCAKETALMPYLIDGHNLIGQLDDIRISDPDDEAKLVMKLRGFCARERTKVLVVFDQGMPGGLSHLSNSVVEVRFAPHQSTADDVLIARIRKTPDPTNWTVVSSDHAVLNCAVERKMRAIRSRDFAQLLRPLNTPLADPTPLPRKPGEQIESPDPGEASDVYLSPAQVAEWLKVFPEPPPPKDPPLFRKKKR